MILFFFVGTGVAFVISRVIMRLFGSNGEGIHRLTIIHAVSGVLLGVLSVIATMVFGIAATAFFYLVACFLPQVLCFTWDISKLSLNWIRAGKS